MYTKDWYRREWQKAKKGRAWYKTVYVITNRENKELKARIANLEYRIKELEMKYGKTR